MLRPVLNQYGTRFVPYFPKCPIQVCHSNVNTEFNSNEQNKTQEIMKTAKMFWREARRTSCEHKHPVAAMRSVPVCQSVSARSSVRPLRCLPVTRRCSLTEPPARILKMSSSEDDNPRLQSELQSMSADVHCIAWWTV